jgi:hypothetical protein
VRQHGSLSTAIASLCDRDMEGIVAKQASARYTPEATTWVKISTDLFRVICDRGHGGDCRKTVERQVHAGGNDLGEDQEPRVQPGEISA